MKFSNLKRADDFEVHKWLENELQLTTYQKECLRNQELIRFSPFYFYRKENKNGLSMLWRLTILLYFPYVIVLIIVTLFKWLLTGNRYLGRNFIDNFHNKWTRAIGL